MADGRRSRPDHEEGTRGARSSGAFLRPAAVVLALVLVVLVVLSITRLAGDGGGASASVEVTTAELTPAEAVPLASRARPAMVWDGDEVLVVGGTRFGAGQGSPALTDGVAYDPEAERWRSLASLPRDVPLVVRDGVWTGEELVVVGAPCQQWEEEDPDDVGCKPGGLAAAGYRPGTDTWRSFPGPAGASDVAHRQAVIALGWTGTEAVFEIEQRLYLLEVDSGRWRQAPEHPYSGKRTCLHGRRLTRLSSTVPGRIDGDPTDGVSVPSNFPAVPTATVLDTGEPEPAWEPVAMRAADAAPNSMNTMCAGEQVLLFGDDGVTRPTLSARFDVTRAAWTAMAPPPVQPGVAPFTLWTGKEALVWVGSGDRVLAYDPAADSWREARPARRPVSATWMGDRAMLYQIEDGRSASSELYRP